MTKRTKNKKIENRQFGVILEDIDSKIDFLVEGHQALDKKIDKVDSNLNGKIDSFKTEMDYKFETVFEKFNEVDKRFDEVDKRFEKVDKRFDEVDKRFEKVDEQFKQDGAQFDEVKDELRVIRNELKEKVSRDEFVLLEKRVLKLEKARG